MSKKLVLPLMLCLLFISSFATVRRVGFWGPAVAGVDYADITAAQTAASNGDTLYIFPGNWSAPNITKRLIIIGGGYLLDSSQTAGSGNKGNADYQYFKNNTSVSFTLKNGSTGSKIFGITGNITIGGVVADIVNDIEVGGLQGFVTVSSSTNNLVMKNCRSNFSYAVFVNTGATINVTNILVQNCIAENGTVVYLNTPGSATGLVDNCTSSDAYVPSGSILFSNNVFTGLTTSSNFYPNCIFNNNLIRGLAVNYPGVVGSSNVYNNFVNSGTTTAANTCFVGWPFQGNFSNDEKFKLAVGSPAIGIGTSGSNAGAFGGNNPYKLSGIPPIPSIYKIGSPQGNNPSGSTITIDFSTRGNN
jgi:hypothetical protein